MVLVGRGEMIPGDPESKGIHAHLPDRNYSIHSHSVTSGRIWNGLLMPPQSLQKSWQREITVETQEGVSWHYSQGSHWRFLPLQPFLPFSCGLLGVQAGKESVVSGRLRVQGSDTGIGGQDHPQCPCFLASLSGGLQRWPLNEPSHF